jgi:hypothetical protein
MPIIESITESIPDQLIPLWRGGRQVPEMLRSYEDAPPSETDGTNVDLHCNIAVVPHGGITDGEIVENSIDNRNVIEEGEIIEGQTYDIPDYEATVDSASGEFTYFTEETIDDNFEL